MRGDGAPAAVSFSRLTRKGNAELVNQRCKQIKRLPSANAKSNDDVNVIHEREPPNRAAPLRQRQRPIHNRAIRCVAAFIMLARCVQRKCSFIARRYSGIGFCQSQCMLAPKNTWKGPRSLRPNKLASTYYCGFCSIQAVKLSLMLDNHWFINCP